MATMNYKQKIKDYMNSSEVDTLYKSMLTNLFPELKESEDERVRKEIISAIKEDWPGHTDWIAWLEKQGESSIKWNKNTEGNKPQVNHSVLMKTTHGIAEGEWQGEYWHQYRWAGIVRDSDVLSWVELSDLEKQGEQKPTDKIEPKFKVKYAGSEYNVLEIKDIVGITYYGIEDEPNHIDYVLPDNCEIVSEQSPAWREEDEMFVHGLIRGLVAMKNIHGHTTFSSDGIDITKTIDWLKSLKDRVGCEVNCTTTKDWSEEDKDAEKAAEEYKNFRMCCGIKDPVMLNEIEEAYYEGAIRQQKSVELDEENECNVINICAHLRSVLTDEAVEKYRNWLKSLRPQSTWKPSDEQMKILNEVLNFAANHESPHWNDYIFGTLNNLIRQLKKLK